MRKLFLGITAVIFLSLSVQAGTALLPVAEGSAKLLKRIVKITESGGKATRDVLKNNAVRRVAVFSTKQQADNQKSGKSRWLWILLTVAGGYGVFCFIKRYSESE